MLGYEKVLSFPYKNFQVLKKLMKTKHFKNNMYCYPIYLYLKRVKKINIITWIWII